MHSGALVVFPKVFYPIASNNNCPTLAVEGLSQGGHPRLGGGQGAYQYSLECSTSV